MILNPKVPSDATPQVRVASPGNKVIMTFWQEKGTNLDLDALADVLMALPRQHSWRAHARRGRHSSGYSFGGCHVTISVPGQGCTNDEFDDTFAEFEREVMMVANR